MNNKITNLDKIVIDFELMESIWLFSLQQLN